MQASQVLLLKRYVVALILVSAVLVTGCPGAAKARKSAGGPANVVAVAGPNSVATGFVDGMKSRDLARLRDLSVEPVREYWGLLAESYAFTLAFCDELRKLYPNEDHKILGTLEEQCLRPVTSYQKITLDGILSGSAADGKVVYQVSYTHPSGYPQILELTCILVDGAWKVRDWGEKLTPTKAHLGELRTQIGRFRIAHQDARSKIAAAPPKTLREALLVVQSSYPDTTLKDPEASGVPQK